MLSLYTYASGDNDSSMCTLGSVDFAESPKLGRAWAKIAAERFFYVIAEGIAKRELSARLIELIPASVNSPESYYGEYYVNDYARECTHGVSIFRHCRV